jgi:hypothetical protein
MGKRIFVSYSHKQGDWVRDRLCPVLRAGGADVLIDVHRFQAGVAVHRQMDAIQDQAQIHLLVLSPDYLASAYCLHEMKRAVAADPSFSKGCVLPVVREACTLPPEIAVPGPLYVKLMDDSKGDQWDLVTARCEADLGVSAAEWLRAREQVRDGILDGRSVNLVVMGSPNHKGLLDQLREDLGALAIVDLASGAAAGRQGLITEILHELGTKSEARRPPNDLRDLHTCVMAAPAPVRLAFRHFDILKSRANNYKEDFFSALKFLVEARKLVLLIESRAPYATLLPATNSLSKIQMKTVELRGRTP